MTAFIYINCPNCKVKIKIAAEKKYHDCPECKYEFRIDDLKIENIPSAKTATKESIFGKFTREQGL